MKIHRQEDLIEVTQQKLELAVLLRKREGPSRTGYHQETGYPETEVRPTSV